LKTSSSTDNLQPATDNSLYRPTSTTATAATPIPHPCLRVGRSPSIAAASKIVDAGYSDASTAATSSLPARVAAIKIRFPDVSSTAVDTAHSTTVLAIPTVPRTDLRAPFIAVSCDEWGARLRISRSRIPPSSSEHTLKLPILAVAIGHTTPAAPAIFNATK
jgi:hypothetical protein